EAERHLFLGGFEQAGRAGEMAIALITGGAGPECEGKARLLLAEARLHQGQHEAAASAIGQAEGPVADRLRGLLAIARGDREAGVALLERASEAARQRGLVRLEARSLLALAEVAPEAAALEEAYALAESEQLPDLLACCLLGLARRRLEAGDELVAERLQRRGEALIDHLLAQMPGPSARQAFLAHPERRPFLAVPGPSEASRLARQGRRLEMLLELGAALGRVREPERVLALVHDFTREVTRAERCLVLLGADAQGLALARGAGGYSRTIVQQVLVTRQPLCVLDTQDDQALSASASVLALALRAVMCVPLVVEEALLGVIYVDSQVALGAFTEDDMRVLTAIANQAAVALDGARLHAALQSQLDRQEDYIRRLEESAHVIRHLEELDRVRAEYFQGASHDLRGPLNSINASCQALLKGLFGPLATEQQETVEGIHHGSRTLVALIDSVLDGARLEAGKLYMNPQTVDLARPVGEAVRLLSALAAEKGIALRFDPAAMAALPPVRGDERRLMQIVINLLGNAIKFTAQGHVRLSASAGAGTVALVVEDSGPGLPPERLATPFERYGSTSAVAPGSGLGLWLVKGLVELHEGTIAVESRPGEGCVFTVRLPVA
ncbi:MAG: ATP-binding protein, partial [Candidatus Sericytochromatia bacterium]